MCAAIICNSVIAPHSPAPSRLRVVAKIERKKNRSIFIQCVRKQNAPNTQQTNKQKLIDNEAINENNNECMCACISFAGGRACAPAKLPIQWTAQRSKVFSKSPLMQKKKLCFPCLFRVCVCAIFFSLLHTRKAHA